MKTAGIRKKEEIDSLYRVMTKNKVAKDIGDGELDKSLSYLTVTDFREYLGIGGGYVSPTINLLAINSIIAYPKDKKKTASFKYTPSISAERLTVERGGRSRNRSIDTTESQREFLDSFQRGSELRNQATIPQPINSSQRLTTNQLEDRISVNESRLMIENERLIHSIPGGELALATEATIRNIESVLTNFVDELYSRNMQTIPIDRLENLQAEAQVRSSVVDMDFEEVRIVPPMYQWETSKSPIYKVKEEAKKLTYNELKKQYYNDVNSNYGGIPAIIKGYIIRDVLYTSNEEIQTIHYSLTNDDYKRIRTIVKVFTLNEDYTVKSKIILVRRNQFQKVGDVNVLRNLVPIIFSIKIKGSTNSDKVFAEPTARKKYISELTELIGSIYDTNNFTKFKEVPEWTLELSKCTTLGTSTYHVVVMNNEDKKLKFLLQDCEFNNPELKGYVPPKDKTMEVNTVVKVKSNRLSDYNISISNSLATIIGIKGNPASKRISKNCRNRRIDIITIRLNNSNIILTVYAEDLKFLEKPKKEYVINEKKVSRGKESVSFGFIDTNF